MDKFLAKFGIHRNALVSTMASNVMRTIEQEYKGENTHEARNATIDTMVQILQNQKIEDVPVVPVAEPAPVVPPAV